ncbi:UNVERIFIED_CONTAM: hypothetical protein PYX00_005252 [Menopon gallinae]|uniref:Uncharacterized protein n=1 Tax=Menopon gallinae TaxID=328185 RepID=A0AAW2HQN6_9NEOP
MLFIACYHVLMRQMPVLVGLLAPAIIMILYLIWLLYYAMKRKRTEVSYRPPGFFPVGPEKGLAPKNRREKNIVLPLFTIVSPRPTVN